MSDFIPPISYEKRLVALIDVMGFKELLTNDALEKLQQFYEDANEFLIAKGRLYEQTAATDDFKKLFVSDSIILSVKLNTDDDGKIERTEENFQIAARFFAAISLLQFLMAFKTNIWMRGAISIGNLFIDENRNILVGPAFVDAYFLEKKADYPRVIIDPKVCSKFGQLPSAFIDKINSLGFSSQIIGPSPRQRIGSHMASDAIQLDWFRQTFDRVERIEPFFKDLKSRISLNQGLMEKCNKLLTYIRESWTTYSMSPHAQQFEERMNKVDVCLREFGY